MITTPRTLQHNISRVLLCLGFVCLFLLLPPLATADIPGAEEAITHMDVAMTTIEKAMKGSKGGHADTVSTLAREAITHSEAAIKVMPLHDGHGRQASDLLKEAITHLHGAVETSGKGSAKKAGADVMSALDFVEAALMHVQHAH